MESNWAAQNLLTIRTLMERSALYRRALAPMMVVAGSIGLIGGILPCFTPIETNRQFSLYWLALCIVTAGAAFYLVRREAVKEAEPFWSPPTRRVTQALLPAFTAGFTAALLYAFHDALPESPSLLAAFWVVSYGVGLHAAAFFTQRGVRAFGWLFTLSGCALFCLLLLVPHLQTAQSAHTIMGAAFGLAHLAYGFYLCFTEKRGRPS